MFENNLMYEKKQSGGKAIVFKNPRVLYPPSDVTTQTDFGRKITESLDGEILAINAPSARNAAGTVTSNGLVYLYDAKTLTLLQTLYPQSNGSGQRFGEDVVFNKDRSRMYVAAPGYVGSGTVGRICIYKKAADGLTYAYENQMVGVQGASGFANHITHGEADGFIFSGMPTVGGTYANEGRVDKWKDVGSTRISSSAYASPAASDSYGRSTAYSESLGGVVFAGMPQTAGSASKNGLVNTYSANATALATKILMPKVAAVYTNLNFGYRMELSPSGKSLAVIANGYRKANHSGNPICGSIDIFDLTRSGNVLGVVRSGFIDLSDLLPVGGNAYVKWIGDDNLVIGHVDVVVGGVTAAGAITQAVRTGNDFELITLSTPSGLPMPDEQVPVALRNLGVSLAVGVNSKRLFAGGIRDMNSLDQPTGRVLIWDYE